MGSLNDPDWTLAVTVNVPDFPGPMTKAAGAAPNVRCEAPPPLPQDV